jgi:lipopolysaccharide/colanic/teichoic acid biosynthesis glycosyltransferase
MLRDLPVLSFPTTPPLGAAIAVKRAMDVLGAVAGLVVFGVVYCLYGWRIRRESPGPVLFKQARIGQNGRWFVLYKFRTMANGAQTEQARLAGTNEMQGPMFKMRDDPRITPVGKRLRARYLDELPQFWNVLRGEMSLVGTRPPTPEEVASYHLSDHGRLAWKPGLTGLWQVNGSGEVQNFDDVVRLDREYIEKWSLGLDLMILARTVGKMIRAEGW